MFVKCRRFRLENVASLFKQNQKNGLTAWLPKHGFQMGVSEAFFGKQGVLRIFGNSSDGSSEGVSLFRKRTLARRAGWLCACMSLVACDDSMDFCPLVVEFIVD